jgi:hypothetical protein
LRYNANNSSYNLQTVRWMRAAVCFSEINNLGRRGLMLHASDVNASSLSSENSNADSAHKTEDYDDDGSQQPSPSLFRLQQANQNADATEDDDIQDNESVIRLWIHTGYGF